VSGSGQYSATGPPGMGSPGSSTTGTPALPPATTGQKPGGVTGILRALVVPPSKPAPPSPSPKNTPPPPSIPIAPSRPLDPASPPAIISSQPEFGTAKGGSAGTIRPSLPGAELPVPESQGQSDIFGVVREREGTAAIRPSLPHTQ
jgi:hypothetical protein